MSKRKYWIKLNQHFFGTDNIQYLEAQENGDRYIKIWLKLLLRCLKDEEDIGFLRFNEKIPYTAELLAKVLHDDIDSVRVAMKIFRDMGMMEILDDGTLYIEEVQKLIGSESESAERVRIHRERKKELLQCNGKVTDCNTIYNTDINTYIDTSINIETPKKTKIFIPPSLEQITEYCEDRDNCLDPKAFYDYYNEGDWKDKDGKKIKNWKQKIITWEGRDQKTQTRKEIRKVIAENKERRIM